MKTTIITYILFSFTTPLLAENNPQSKRFEHFGTAYQFVFYAVLEGLYQDGATQEQVDQILMKQTDEHGYEHFVYSCPICTSVQLACELYSKRPTFRMYKPDEQSHQITHATFGAGFSEQVKRGLYADDVSIRLETLHDLIAKWTSDRMARMNLSKTQRQDLIEAIAVGREQGIRALAQFKQDPAQLKRYAPGYTTLQECVMCNGASGKVLAETAGGQDRPVDTDKP